MRQWLALPTFLKLRATWRWESRLTFFNAVLLGALVVGIFMHLCDALDALVEVVFISYTLA